MDISKDSPPTGGKKILIFSTAYLPFIGGAELAVKEITERIRDIEFHMITARMNRKLLKFEIIGNVSVHRIGFGVPVIDKYWLAFFGHRFARKLHEKNRYDLIWSTMASYGGFAAMFFKKKNPKTPFLLTLQEGDDPKYIKKRVGFLKSWFGRIFANADYIQCISHFLADWAKQNGATCPIEVVPNGVDLDKLKTKNEKRKVNEKIIITTSRLVYKNGIDILIKAAAKLKTLMPNLKFMIQIVGSGQEEGKLKKLTQELNVKDVVDFVGHVDPKLIHDCLTRADIFVRPSRSEGLGSSFLEAMAARLPIIGTLVGGIPDFLKDPSTSSRQAVTGLFTKIDDPQDLALKIKELLENENLRQTLIQNGLKLVKEKYDWNLITEKMKNIFEKLTCNSV